MSTTLILVLLVAMAVAAGWFMVSRADSEPAEPAPRVPSGGFRCKVCGAKSATFAVAHEHASAEHELAGHHIDDSIVQE
jgi:hypothetical protein